MQSFSRHFFSGVLLMGLGITAQGQDAGTELQTDLPGEKIAAPPYGMPITLAQSEKVIAAAKGEAARLKSNLVVIAVTDTHGELVAFARLDDATFHSVAFAQLKARGAARSRRVTATPPTDTAAALTATPDFVTMPGGGNDLQIAKAAVKGMP